MNSLKTKPNQTQPILSVLSESRQQQSTHRPFFSGMWFRDWFSGNLIWKSVSAVHMFFCVVCAASVAYYLMLHTQWNILQEEDGR